MMGWDDEVSRIERVIVAGCQRGRPAALGWGDTLWGGGGLLGLDTGIANQICDKALGRASGGCSEVAERSGGSALWADLGGMFCSVRLLPLDGGLKAADP